MDREDLLVAMGTLGGMAILVSVAFKPNPAAVAANKARQAQVAPAPELRGRQQGATPKPETAGIQPVPSAPATNSANSALSTKGSGASED